MCAFVIYAPKRDEEVVEEEVGVLRASNQTILWLIIECKLVISL